ncbi:polyhydroxybutyrate depolymerase [Bradymonadaceae bacterium TMQ3]|nr:polyhydroxybutyrate depolymerase [Bradymonadaceae bacterium TMQ3]TXC77851.1 polyhydroxybutyrate depolymerase [Bradymonadales bacterium TMQ1]
MHRCFSPPQSRTSILAMLLTVSLVSSCRALRSDADPAPTAEPETRVRIDAAFREVDASRAASEVASAGCTSDARLYPGGESHERALFHDGLERTTRVFIPSSYTPGVPMPVVFVLHGGFGSGEQIETRSAEFNPIAEREGFIVVYPDGVESDGLLKARTWNGGDCCGYASEANIDDVGFVMALLDSLETQLCIDTSRVYSTGMSNGAIMSYRLACEASERIAAIAPVAAPQVFENCNPTHPVALLHIHGTDDPNAPYEGGEGCGFANITFPPAMEGMQVWRDANLCEGAPADLLSLGAGHCQTLGDCGSPVVRCLVEGGGHSWPGGQPPALQLRRCEGGHHTTDFAASEVIWRFFSGQSR